jgi:tetratricopeptide (TPR) repeat protein
MLFDLRGRGRRRTVQVIYLTLAILMGGGLVLFGIGGNTNGGLLDAFSGGNSQSTNDIVEKRLAEAEAAVKARPQDSRALAGLARAHYQAAEFDQNAQAFTDKGKSDLAAASRAWERYLTTTDKPDANVASLMVQAYSGAGLNQPEKAVTAMEIIVDSREATAPLYVQLATLAYSAGQTRKAELASDKALELAPKDQREQIKAQLEAAKSASSAAGSTATTTTPSS